MKGNRKNKECGKMKFKANGRVVEAAELLKNAMLDEQAKIIAQLKAERDEAVGKQEQLEVLFVEVCKERDWFEKCLKSAESALAYKDKVIEKIKKKRSGQLAEKQDVIVTLNKEIEYQYKRREKAENFIKGLCEGLLYLTEKANDYDGSK